jgi:hypothetical protein
MWLRLNNSKINVGDRREGKRDDDGVDFKNTNRNNK